MMPEYDLLLPKTLLEALDYAKTNPKLELIAGGTNMVVDLRSGRRSPKVLMNISDLKELRGINIEGEYVVVGGGVTIGELYKHTLIKQHGQCLHQASAVFANPLVCNRATIGGNLADASPAADTATPLLALGAEVELVNEMGKRYVSLEDFFLGVRRTVLKQGEIISAVRWHIPPSNSVNIFYKLGLRKADAISVVSAAIMIVGGEKGEVKQVRIALGSVAPIPLRVKKAEEILKGHKLNKELINQAGQIAAESTSPICDVRATAEYRRKVSGVLVSRLLWQVAEKI